jgi:UDP-galactopyranose mutase
VAEKYDYLVLGAGFAGSVLRSNDHEYARVVEIKHATGQKTEKAGLCLLKANSLLVVALLNQRSPAPW